MLGYRQGHCNRVTAVTQIRKRFMDPTLFREAGVLSPATFVQRN